MTKTIDAFFSELGSHGIDSDGATAGEIAKATGASEKVTRRRLHELMAAGRLVVGRGYRTSIVGVKVSVPTYRLKAKPKVRKEAK